MRSFPLRASLLAGLLCLGAGALSQTPQSAPVHTPAPAAAAPYTLTARARLVVTDVQVTDAQGRPVHGLTAQDFRIFDDGKPQQIRNFQEQAPEQAPEQTSEQATRQTPARPPAQPLPPGVYSNAELTHLPPTVTVLLLDPFNTTVPEQMYLRLQILRAIRRLSGHSIAVVGLNSGHGAVLLQTFTTNPALLRAAVDREIPRLTSNGGGYIEHFNDALTALGSLSAYLSRIPGHKDLLWFSGKFPLVEQAPGFLNGARAQTHSRLTHIYNQLSLDRVAVSPVDIKGPEIAPAVTMVGEARPQGSEDGGANADSGGRDTQVSNTAGGRDISTEVAMDRIAAVTGGRTFYDRNDLGRFVQNTITRSADYYTLSYRPHPYTGDNRFHTIHVQVAGGAYTLHYRSGYVAFADLSNDAASTLDSTGLKQINSDLHTLESGGRLPVTERNQTDSLTDYTRAAPAQDSILFKARIRPASQVPGWHVLAPSPGASGHRSQNAHDPAYVIEYGALARDIKFTSSSASGSHATVLVAALACDDDGRVLGSAFSRVGLDFDQKQMQLASRIGVPLRQQIRLPKKKLIITVSLVDTASGHTGTLQIPFPTPAKP